MLGKSRQQELRAKDEECSEHMLLVSCVLSILCTLGESLPRSCSSTIAVAGLPSSVEVKIISAEAL